LEPLDFSLLPATAAVIPGGLEIGGVSVLDVAATVGTPVFIYDQADLRARFHEAYSIFGDGVAYATKAFLCKAIARLAFEQNLSLDVASGGEYYTCRQAGVPAHKLVLHGNNKSAQEVALAIEEGAQWIVIDGFGDLELIAETATRLRKRVQVLIRVNPGVEVHTHRFNRTGNRRSKFGFPMWNGDAEAALNDLHHHEWLDLIGLHMHVGSLVFSTDTFLSALNAVADFVKMADLPIFVVGGGLGVRYLNSDTAPSLREWADAIFDYCDHKQIKSKILAEPGRSLVASTAITCYSVGRLEAKDMDTYVAVDGGMSDNPRPLLYDSGYELFLIREPLAERESRVTLVGSHCEAGDTLVRDGGLPLSTKLGDVIATPVTGAYGYSMASNYNKMPRPAVVFAENGEATVVIRRETYADLLACDQPLDRISAE
jgi:diaminopimelate decarboxylase